MSDFARTAASDPLLGDDEGYVPLAAAVSDAESVRDVLRMAPDALLDPETVIARRGPASQLTFGPPLTEPLKLFCIGLN